MEYRLAPLFGSRPTNDSLENSLCAEITASEAILSVACDPSCLPFVLFDVRPPEQFNRNGSEIVLKKIGQVIFVIFFLFHISDRNVSKTNLNILKI